MYFALAGFAIGFGAGIGVLVSSSSQRTGGGAAVASPGRASAEADGSGGSATPEADPPGGGSASPGATGSGGGSPEGPVVKPREPIEALIAEQRAAIGKGDLAALAGRLAPNAFGFGVDADEVAEGRDAIEVQLRKDLGDLVADGATALVRYQNVGEERDHAWIALELDVSARGRPTRRFAVTELAARLGGAWTVVAWHWATPVLDATAERMAVLGTKPSPRPIASVLIGPEALDAAVREALGSRRGFAAARSEHGKGFNFGSGPSERILGGAAVKRVFGRLRAEIRLHDGVRVVGGGSWDPAQRDAPTVAFAAANVDYTTRTRAATSLTHTFRVLAVLLLEDGAWKIVQTQWSHGGPIR
jgi:ketosteroid isomerase-like protein